MTFFFRLSLTLPTIDDCTKSTESRLSKTKTKGACVHLGFCQDVGHLCSYSIWLRQRALVFTKDERDLVDLVMLSVSKGDIEHQRKKLVGREVGG